eukprot:m.10620 g.10620  ORF g.10620 m.10620 type:complete len:287 (-) comp6643_c0_seq1:73-933(-)
MFLTEGMDLNARRAEAHRNAAIAAAKALGTHNVTVDFKAQERLQRQREMEMRRIAEQQELVRAQQALLKQEMEEEANEKKRAKMTSAPAHSQPLIPTQVQHHHQQHQQQRHHGHGQSHQPFHQHGQPSFGATLTSATTPAVVTTTITANGKDNKKKKQKPNRIGGGEKWFDASMDEWPKDDFRIFCGDLGNEVGDEALFNAFKAYPSLQKAKVVRNVRNKKSKGYGFVSFKEGKDFLKALKEMNGKYIGNRPVKLRKSTWTDRDIKTKRKQQNAKGKGKGKGQKKK